MNKEQIQQAIIQKQDEYITYLMRLIRSTGIIWDISIGPRGSYESELASLQQQLSECKDEKDIDPDNIKFTPPAHKVTHRGKLKPIK